KSDTRPPDAVWHAAVMLLGIWAVVGLANISASILVSLHADRMAHRNRLAAMGRYFEHVMELPLAYHRGTHSGRLLKVMMTGASNLFNLWLSFFREHLSTLVAFLVLLPMTLLMNWRLGSLLLVLIALFALLTLFVV